MKSYSLYLRLLRYLKPYKGILALSLLAMVISALTEPAFASLMKPLIDGNFVGAAEHRDLLKVPLMIVGVFLLRGVTTFINEYSSSWVSQRLIFDLRKEMFAHMLTLPAGYYDRHASSELVSRIAYETPFVASAGFNIVTVTVKDGLTILGLLGLMFYTDWRLTLICTLVLPVFAISVRQVSKRMRRLSRNTQQAIRQVSQVIEETARSQRVVKIYGGQNYENQRFNQFANDQRTNEIKQISASSANSNFVQLAIAAALAVIIYYASVRASSGQLTAGDFMSFLTAMLMLFAPLKRLTGINNALQRGLAAAESIFGLIDELSEPNQGKTSKTKVQGDLVFNNVAFSYPSSERRALDGISLTIRAGETVALVGGSGGGKTTIANMIPRFYVPDSGEITLDGLNLNEYDLVNLRQHIALVSQDVVLFNDTIAANIAYGSSDKVTKEQIAEAARQAHAYDFIMEMPKGFDTEIGENGTRLSGGQKQRLAIARALLKDASILILDEATSALDNESEHKVQIALQNLTRERTTLVIAHRLSTIEQADRIVVLQRGQIVEEGNHETLLKLDGVYAQLHRNQFEEEHS